MQENLSKWGWIRGHYVGRPESMRGNGNRVPYSTAHRCPNACGLCIIISCSTIMLSILRSSSLIVSINSWTCVSIPSAVSFLSDSDKKTLDWQIIKNLLVSEHFVDNGVLDHRNRLWRMFQLPRLNMTMQLKRITEVWWVSNSWPIVLTPLSLFTL